MSHVAWSVCLFVGHTDLLCKNGWTDQNAVQRLTHGGQDPINPFAAARGEKSAMRLFAKLLSTLVTKGLIACFFAGSLPRRHVRFNGSVFCFEQCDRCPSGRYSHHWLRRGPQRQHHGLADACVAGDAVRPDRPQRDRRRRQLQHGRQRVDLHGGPGRPVRRVRPTVGPAAARLPRDDGLRQRPGLPQRLSRAKSPHRDQLLHRLAGHRRSDGRHSRYASGRLRRGLYRNPVPETSFC